MKDVHVVAAIIHSDGRILAAKRLAGGPSGLKWEFPGGKVEPNEEPQAALRREILEELGLDVIVNDEIGAFVTDIGGLRIRLHCFHCRADGELVSLAAHSEVVWRTPDDLGDLDWALPDVPVLVALGIRAD